MWKEFKEFALRGNVMDMAIGIVIGAAFGTIVKSLVDDIVLPPIGMLLGGVDFSALFIMLKEGTTAPPPYNTLLEARNAGAVTLNYGNFLNTILTFLIIAFSIFLVVKGMNNMRRKQEEIPPEAPTTKECPFCFSTISVKATKCPSCTAQL
jgi:large conductance mechanosensitive channel